MCWYSTAANIGDSRLPIPNQLSSFPPFNYGRPAKIAVSSIGLRQIYRYALPPASVARIGRQTSAGTNVIAQS